MVLNDYGMGLLGGGVKTDTKLIVNRRRKPSVIKQLAQSIWDVEPLLTNRFL
jgi:hypothetical protein